MKKLVYSYRYKVKLKEIKRYLEIRFGNMVSKRTLREITDKLHYLQQYENSGVSIRELFGINTDYRYVYVAHNYVFYRSEADSIYIVNIYNEREDYMMKLFGIKTTTQETEDYWGE